MKTHTRRVRVVVSPLVLAVALGLLAKDALFDEEERPVAEDGGRVERVAGARAWHPEAFGRSAAGHRD